MHWIKFVLLFRKGKPVLVYHISLYLYKYQLQCTCTMLNYILILLVNVHAVCGQVQFKMLKIAGKATENIPGYAYKCKTITFSENKMIGCSAKCFDPESTKWWTSEFYNKIDSDSDISFDGLYCKYFTFTNGQCSTCFRSNGFDPAEVSVPTNPDYIGVNVGKGSYSNIEFIH